MNEYDLPGGPLGRMAGAALRVSLKKSWTAPCRNSRRLRNNRYCYSLMADFLDEKRSEIDARLRELRPLVDEYNRLEKAAAALAGVGNGGRPRAPRALRGGRGRGRPRGSGTRAKQALELVRARPGITITELADAMGIHANYLYRVMPTLESEGQVVKRDKGWHPA